MVALLTAVAVTKISDVAAPPKIALGAAAPMTTIGAIAEADFNATQVADAVTAVAALAEVIFRVSFVAITFAPRAALAVALAVNTLRGVALAVTAVAAVALAILVAPAETAPAITLICATSDMPIYAMRSDVPVALIPALAEACLTRLAAPALEAETAAVALVGFTFNRLPPSAVIETLAVALAGSKDPPISAVPFTTRSAVAVVDRRLIAEFVAVIAVAARASTFRTRLIAAVALTAIAAVACANFIVSFIAAAAAVIAAIAVAAIGLILPPVALAVAAVAAVAVVLRWRIGVGVDAVATISTSARIGN